MPEFKTKLFSLNRVADDLEVWLNLLRRNGYFVRVENVLMITEHSLLAVVFRYVPSQQSRVPGDVSQPEPWKEPEIE